VTSALLGIDIGGTKVAFALGDAAGRVAARRRWQADWSGDAGRDIEKLCSEARRLMASQGGATLGGIGVACPGPLDRARGRVLGPPNLPGWRDVALRAALERELSAPVALENDANAATLAEGRFGAGRGLRDWVFLTMSTGIGAGIVMDGALRRGAGGLAGELGHVPIEPGGLRCACGQQGCLEAYCGGAAWTQHLRQVCPAESRCAERASSPAAVEPAHLIAAARQGDAFALRELDRYHDWLTRGLVQIAFTLAPEAIVLGTIPSAAGPELALAPLRAKLRPRLWPALAERVELRLSTLGEERSYLAGLAVALEGAAERGAAESP